MTRDDIIRMAREAGLCMANDEWPLMERFAALVASAEREACAKVCDNIEDHDGTIGDVEYSDHYSNAIRARGNT